MNIKLFDLHTDLPTSDLNEDKTTLAAIKRKEGIIAVNAIYKGVRERYCLEELYSTGEKADLRYYLNKYRFYNDEKIKSCRSTRELKLVLKSRMKPIKESSKNINVRVLTSPKAIYSKHKSYYKNISLSSNFEVVDNLEDVLPQTYKVSGVSSFGYCSVEVKAI